MHYEPHAVSTDRCVAMSPVKYCTTVKGFVHDIPISEIDSNYQCDPNLAFKAKRDADNRREKEYKSAMKQHSIRSHGDPEDEFF
jgi:hypothetical protein